jgi:hypothetical protein
MGAEIIWNPVYASGNSRVQAESTSLQGFRENHLRMILGPTDYLSVHLFCLDIKEI